MTSGGARLLPSIRSVSDGPAALSGRITRAPGLGVRGVLGVGESGTSSVVSLLLPRSFKYGEVVGDCGWRKKRKKDEKKNQL